MCDCCEFSRASKKKKKFHGIDVWVEVSNAPSLFSPLRRDSLKMGKLMFSTVLVYAVITLTGAEVTGKSAKQSKANARNILQFGNMVQCPFDGENILGFVSTYAAYDGYGCYCGSTSDDQGINVFPVLDVVDSCCQTHDDCYRDAGLTGGWWDYYYYYIFQYSYVCSPFGEITCTNCHTDSMDRMLCECDRAAAVCFFQYRAYYNASMKSEEAQELCVPNGQTSGGRRGDESAAKEKTVIDPSNSHAFSQKAAQGENSALPAMPCTRNALALSFLVSHLFAYSK